jgi:hypothetical protein
VHAARILYNYIINCDFSAELDLIIVDHMNIRTLGKPRRNQQNLGGKRHGKGLPYSGGSSLHSRCRGSGGISPEPPPQGGGAEFAANIANSERLHEQRRTKKEKSPSRD